MFLPSRFQPLFTSLLALALLTLVSGCAVQTQFTAANPVSLAAIEADNYVQVRSVVLEGRLKKHAGTSDLVTPLIAGLATVGDELKAKRESSYADAILDVQLNSKISTRNIDKVKNVPLLGAFVMMYSGSSVTYDWSADVSYSLLSPNGVTLVSDAFLIKGKDTNRVNQFVAGATVYTGAAPLKLLYPSKDNAPALAADILTAAGKEIGARLRRDKGTDYFVARTRERDGMSPQAYAEFQAKKERVKEQHAQRSADLKQQLTARIDNKNGADRLGNGGLMIFGVGVDRYNNFPNLQYAASDCRNLVGWFKETYTLSGDQATCLTNENASAIKVNRFLKRNAAQLLDENDTFVFYFSGHGAPEQSSFSQDGDGLNKYLLLSNTEADAMSMTSVNLNHLFELIDKLPAKRKIILLDSCFSGEAGRTVLAGLKGISLSEKTYHNLTNISGKGTVILAASSENQLSQERDDIGAGLFTHYLVNGLKGRADNNTNGRVDILELFAYVTDKVDFASQGKQTPVLRGQLNRTIEF